MCVPGGSAGPCLRSQGTLGQVELSRCRARGIIGSRRSYARSGPVPLRLTYLVGGSAGPCLRSQGTLGQVGLSRWRARGIIGCRRSYARSGPVPLRLTYLVGRSAGPGLRSQGTLGQVGLSRCRATGNRVFTFLGSLLPWDAASRWVSCFVRARLLWAMIGSSGSLRLLVGGENLEKRHWDSSWRTRASRAGRMPL